MPEAFGFPEGNVYIYTGNATPSTSAVIAHARDTRIAPTRGWDNRAQAGGTYNNHITGQRCDVSIAAVYTVDSTLVKMSESATAIHMKFLHVNAIGSGGYFLYSGRIASVQYVGNEKQPYVYTINAFFNAWSAF